MKKISPLAWGAAALSALGLGWALWPSKKAAAATSTTPTPVDPGTPRSPSLLPPHGNVLVVGDDLASPLMDAVVKQLATYVATHPDYAIAAAGMLATSGPASFDSYYSGVTNGLPTAKKADLVLVSLGFTNAKTGLTDADRAAISKLAVIFADATAGRRPSVLWLLPPDDGFAHILEVQIAVSTLAVGNVQRPLMNTVLSPKAVPPETRDTYFTADGKPSGDGYSDWASQVVAKILNGAPA